MLFTDPKEPSQIPLAVINANNDKNEAEPEQESHNLGESKQNNASLADAIETHEQKVKLNQTLMVNQIIVNYFLDFLLILLASKKFSHLTKSFMLYHFTDPKEPSPGTVVVFQGVYSSDSPPPSSIAPGQRPTGAVSKTRSDMTKPAVPAKSGCRMRQTALPSAPQPQPLLLGPQIRPLGPQQRPPSPQHRPPIPTTKPSANPPVPPGKPKPPSAPSSKPTIPPKRQAFPNVLIPNRNIPQHGRDHEWANE